MRLDPFGPPRTPPAWILTQLQTWNEQMSLGHLLCGSRNPDFLLDIIQRNSEPMPWSVVFLKYCNKCDYNFLQKK